MISPAAATQRYVTWIVLSHAFCLVSMQKNTELQQLLKEAQDGATAKEALSVAAAAATDQANEKIKSLTDEIQQLNEVSRHKLSEARLHYFLIAHIADIPSPQANTGLLNKIRQAEEREKLQVSRDESITLVHVGDMTVDLGRLRTQCQKYFNRLRITQLKSHCIRDKSPAKVVVAYNPKERHAIDVQALLDKGAAIEAQDATYLFRSLDTFNKGHFHTHKLLIPWNIAATGELLFFTFVGNIIASRNFAMEFLSDSCPTNNTLILFF